MKEIVRVHLAKTGYDIEVDAKKSLEGYLRDIERMMGSEEAMYEIEARMVELLGERGVAAGGVITAADVAALRTQMGEPKEFSNGDTAEAATDEVVNKPPKRLMRDPDKAVLAGVCAGIAAYLGINPLWIRLLFILSPFITLGTSLLIYIILWISVPEARTAAEKLQMRGEAVTFDALKQFSVSDDTKVRTKRLAVKIMQICLVFCLLFATLGLIIALIIGTFMGVSVVALMNGFAAQPWAWGLLTSLIVGGVAAAMLSGALMAGAIKWRFGRAALVTIIISLVVGALSMSGIVIFGAQMARELPRDEQRLSRVVELPMPADAAQAKFVETTMPYLDVELRQSSQPMRAEVRYLAIGDEVPQLQIVRQGDNLVVQGDTHCRSRWLFSRISCYSMMPRVIIYGGSLIDNGDSGRYYHRYRLLPSLP